MRRQPTTAAIILVLAVAYLFPLSVLASPENGQAILDCDRRRRIDLEKGPSLESSETYDPRIDSWQQELSTTHFSLNYNITNGNATTHDYAQETTEALEHSWVIEVDSFGFRSPPDTTISVYLLDLPDYGWTVPAWSRLNGWHVGYIAIDVGIPNAGLLNVTCAHEFFHAVQYSYLPVPPSFPADPLPNAFEEDWITEGIPTWIESRVYPSYVGTGSYIAAVNNYMNNPNRLITQLSYYAVLYWIFIDEHHGGINTVENVLQQTTSNDGIYAVNETLSNKGTTFSRVFVEWTTANYLKDVYYSKAQYFGTITLESVSAYDGMEIIDWSEVSDWAAEYREISSSVIYMPMQFLGEESNNVTSILIEHGVALPFQFTLNATGDGELFLMQASSLDKVAIIVRSIGDETSNSIVDYCLKLPSSSYTLEGPKELFSSATTFVIVDTIGTRPSSSLDLLATKSESCQTSSVSTIALADSSSTQSSSQKNTTVVGQASSQNSSEIIVEVVLAHDVAVTGIFNSKTVVGQDYSINVNVTVRNQGNFEEAFNITLYANTTAIASPNVTLTAGSSVSLAFVWNTSGFAEGNYTISAYAWPVSGEANMADNTYTDGTVTVAMPGDIVPDGIIDIFDITIVALAFGSKPGDINWNPVADINSDNLVDIFDIVVVALHFGETG